MYNCLLFFLLIISCLFNDTNFWLDETFFEEHFHVTVSDLHEENNVSDACSLANL